MAVIEELGELGYVDLTIIGRGGFGIVYSGYETAFGRPVAIKISGNRLEDETERRFDRERRALAALPSHPHIVSVYAVARTRSGFPFFVMELVEGGTLRAQSGRLTWVDAFRTGIQISGALETAHRAGVVHRDVKPENILVGGYGDAKLTDFGVASMTTGASTTTAAVAATITHAAPEVLSAGTASPASDVYSLASTLFTLIAGVAPFASGDGGMAHLIARITSEPAPSLQDYGVPGQAANVILGALAKDPVDRPATAQDFGFALSQSLRSAGVEPPSMAVKGTPGGGGELVGEVTQTATVLGRRVVAATPQTNTAPGPKRRSALVAALAGVVVLAGAGAVAVAAPWNSPQKKGLVGAAAATSPGARGTSARATATGAHSVLGTPRTVGTTTREPVGVGSTTASAASKPSGIGPVVDLPPTIDSVVAQSDDELNTVSVQLRGHDANGKALTYSVAGGVLPAGLTLNPRTGLISGTISASAVNATTTYKELESRSTTVTVQVTDGAHSARTAFSWTVRDTAFIMPNYFNAYGCGTTCPRSSTDEGKPSVGNIGASHPFGCTTTRPAGIDDVSKITYQSVAANTVVKWGATISYVYYQTTCPG